MPSTYTCSSSKTYFPVLASTGIMYKVHSYIFWDNIDNSKIKMKDSNSVLGEERLVAHI